MTSSFTPIAYAYKELLDEAKASRQTGKIFFFNQHNVFDCVEGEIENVIENKDGQFVVLTPPATLRIDRIITLYGKPFAAVEPSDVLREGGLPVRKCDKCGKPMAFTTSGGPKPHPGKKY